MQLLVEGMGGGIELVGGLCIVLVNLAGWRTGTLPRDVGVEGLVAGTAGVASVALVAGDVLVVVFGVGAIAWYVRAGISLLRGTLTSPATPTSTGPSPVASRAHIRSGAA